MSTLIENVSKVTAAHAALKEAIASKGVAVPEGTKLTDMPALVEQISTEPVPTAPRAAFAGDDSTSLVVPKTLVVVDITAVTNISYFFYNCKSLASLTFPAGFGQKATNPRGCFSYCTSLTSLTLPEGFGQAAMNTDSCFDHCTSLASLTLPAGFGQKATNLYGCFSSCKSLASLTLPAGFGQKATNLYYCFDHCESLASLTLPAGFGQAAILIPYCFQNCSALTSLHLPTGFGQNSTSNGNCFSNCKALTTITGNPNFKATVDISPCIKLTHDSLMVVINGLQTVTTAQTIKLGTTNLAKLTDEEKKVATDKGWTLA